MPSNAPSQPESARAMLERAARPSMETIASDCLKVSASIAVLLQHIGSHLFHPALNVAHMKRACGVHNNSVSIKFHQEVGVPPKTYITQRRLETGARLLRQTNLRVWRIAVLVGYTGLGVFSKAFNRWSKTRPSAYRKQVRSLDRELDQRTARFDEDHLRRACAGTLDAPEAKQLIEMLVERYPERETDGTDDDLS